MIRPVVPWPDARLRRAAAPVEAITDEIRAICAPFGVATLVSSVGSLAACG